MTPDTTPSNSPKRKRNEQTTPKKISPTKLSRCVTPTSLEDSDAVPASPRTQVSAKFENLQLEAGKETRKLDFSTSFPQRDSSMDNMDKVRKKPKTTKFNIGQDIEVPETPAHAISRTSLDSDEELGSHEGDAPVPALDPLVFKGMTDIKESTGKITKAYPSINRLSETKSRYRKSPGTSPSKPKFTTSIAIPDTLNLDQDRASLTWHDDELTVFDPDDPDDDGEGIDGVGFRPTAARADARQLKKKRQLEEYRNRENREARAKRFEKRAASFRSAVMDEAASPRKVRFSDADSTSMIST